MAETATSVLTQVSDGLAAAVERAGASTVLVNARRRFPASGVVWGADGIVVTADHVVEREEEIVVGLPDGGEAPAALVGRDAGSDLAVLRVSGKQLAAAERAPSDQLKVGQIVLALGRPAKGLPMASFGVISAVGGPWRTLGGGRVDGFVRADVTFFPGFSGGPLVDTRGRVAGINSSRLGRGAGLTIPSAAVASIVETLVRQGRIRRGYLGISSQQVRLPEALAAKLSGQSMGLLIVGVEPGSPAEAAGITIGDILVSLGGAPVTDTDDLQAQLGPEQVGRPADATVLRGGEPRQLTITVGERA